MERKLFKILQQQIEIVALNDLSDPETRDELRELSNTFNSLIEKNDKEDGEEDGSNAC